MATPDSSFKLSMGAGPDFFMGGHLLTLFLKKTVCDMVRRA